MIHRSLLRVTVASSLLFAACSSAPSASDPDEAWEGYAWPEGQEPPPESEPDPQSEPPPEKDPQPEPEPAPEPPPVYRLLWKKREDVWNYGVALTPWGDVVAYGRQQVVVHDRDTGLGLATVEVEGSLLKHAAGFVGDRTLVIAAERRIHRFTFPGLERADVVVYHPDRGEHEVDDRKDAEVAAVGSSVAAVGWRTGEVKVYALPGGEELGRFDVGGRVRGLALSPDERRLAIGYDDAIVIGDLQAWTQRELRPKASSEAMCFSPDGAQLFAKIGFYPERWELKAPRKLDEGHEGGSSIEACAFLEGGWVLTSGSDGLRWYRPGTRRPLPFDGYSGSEGTVGLATLQGGTVVCAGLRTTGVLLLTRLADWKPPEPPFERAEIWRQQLRAHPKNQAKRDRLKEAEPWGYMAPSSTVTSFLGEEGSTDPNAYFARLRVLEIGGEFDVAADEEVHAALLVEGDSRTLMDRTLDLPGGGALEAFTVDGCYIELAPAETFSIAVDVNEKDMTEWEHIARTRRPLLLKAAEFAETETERELELTTIELTEGVLLWQKKVTIEGATAKLGWIRAPRRDAEDDASRAEFRALFGDVVDLPVEDFAQARALAGKLVPAAEKANAAAGRSLHTYVRKTLPQVAAQAGHTGALAREVGAVAEVPDRIAALKEAGDAIPHAAPLEELHAALRAVTDSEPPRTAHDVGRIIEATQALGLQVDRFAGQNHPSQKLDVPIQELLKTLQQARKGVIQLGALRKRYAALCERVRAELS